MGKALFDVSETARQVFKRADEILGFALTRMCFEGPEQDLNDTINAQPAILTVSIACLNVLRERWQAMGQVIAPQYVAGHSLGEFTALVAADVIDFENALVLVRERGRLMKENGTLRPGGMLAVLGLDKDVVEAVVAEAGALGVITVGNANSPGQILLSGEGPALDRARSGAVRTDPAHQPGRPCRHPERPRGRPGPYAFAVGMKRVVVTGVGAVTPVGLDAPSTWAALLEGQSGVGKITLFDASEFPVQIAGEVKGFDATGRIEPKELRRMDRYAQLGLVAAQEAFADAGLARNGLRDEVGVIFGSAAGGLGVFLEQQRILQERGLKRVSPTFIQNMLTDTASGHIAIALGLRGPNMAVVSACATGSGAVGGSFQTLRRGGADAVVTRGAEACLIPGGYARVCAMRGTARPAGAAA